MRPAPSQVSLQTHLSRNQRPFHERYSEHHGQQAITALPSRLNGKKLDVSFTTRRKRLLSCPEGRPLLDSPHVTAEIDAFEEAR